MDLLLMQQQIRNLNKEANTLKGGEYRLPYSILDNTKSIDYAWCTVEEVDLSENYVEVIYLDPDDGEPLSTTVDIKTFVKYIEGHYIIIIHNL